MDLGYNTRSYSSYAPNQAALCALRVIKKVPDLTDHFISKAKNLLADRNHGVLLTAITLVIEMVQAEPVCLDEFRNVRVIHMSPTFTIAH